MAAPRCGSGRIQGRRAKKDRRAQPKRSAPAHRSVQVARLGRRPQFGVHGDTEVDLDLCPLGGSRVRERLGARLVERRIAELVNILERRYGDLWARRVVDGDFPVNESIRRICEAFGLRLALERQLLHKIEQLARSWPSERGVPVRTDDSDDVAGDWGPESDVGWSPTPSDNSPAPSPMMCPAEAQFSVAELEMCADSVSGAGYEERAKHVSKQMQSGVGGAVPGRMPWSVRVMRTLGIEHLANPSRSPESETKSELTAKADDREKKSDDDSLSSRLFIAVCNGERHAGAHLSATSSAPSSVSCPSEHRRRKSDVLFAEQAEVSFFPLHGNHSIQYERILSTKSFDGRSGHRAQRTVSESSPHSGQQPLKQEEGASTVDAEEEAEDEDEWKDRCDDIADLMVKQRHMLLWSSSWG